MVDVDTMLTKHHLSEPPRRFSAHVNAYWLMWTHTLHARKNGRKPHCYVDITAKEFLPDRIPQDAVGGKSMVGTDVVMADTVLFTELFATVSKKSVLHQSLVQASQSISRECLIGTIVAPENLNPRVARS